MIEHLSRRYEERADRVEEDVGSSFGYVSLQPNAPGKRDKLDSFPKGTLAVDRLRELAVGAKQDTEFLKWITDPEAIPKAQTKHISVPGPKSDLRPSFVQQCLKAGVIQQLRRQEKAQGMVAVFTTPKKDPHIHRTIIDGRPINQAMQKPPKFSLFSPPDLSKKLRKVGARFGCVVDMKGWFHQFRLCEETASFFVFRNGTTWYKWTRLPMGWAYAPLVAQRGSEALVGEMLQWAAVYLDDILIVGCSVEECTARTKLLLERIAYVGGEINTAKSSLSPSPVVIYIGVEWNLGTNTFRFPQEWRDAAREKFTAFAYSPREHTVRELWNIFGITLRVLHVCGTPLCFFPQMMERMKMWAKAIASGPLEWDSVVRTPDALVAEITEGTRRALGCDSWMSLPPKFEFYGTVIFTDASTTGWGVVVQKWGDPQVHEYWGKWEKKHTHKEIFQLEAAAVAKGMAYGGGNEKEGVLLFVDNDALAICCETGRSRVRLVNSVLSSVFTQIERAALQTQWISTKVMPADEPSRRAGSGHAIRAPGQTPRVDLHFKVGNQGFFI